ncbi:SDR family NAD(P)-dependent oxidoreductase, partial [Azospirillum endophyticum]|uniref:SDR family NAD(P)-dependent oxidoreductase n=1 Tax=Azospirillum endophyticum TaxID=2800326 RepID=UPI001B3B568A
RLARPPHSGHLLPRINAQSRAEVMKGNGHGGSIVNISSSAGMRGTPGAFAYSATKWAVRGMSRAAAISLARRKIRVNSVYPGLIDTDMVKFRSPEETEKRLSRVPMRRMGTSDEVAAIVIFLLSDDSAYMTGAEITVDGGATL